MTSIQQSTFADPPRGDHDGVQDRLRIGVIAPPWLPVPPRGYGGTEIVVDQLCRGLRNAGHDVTLVAHAASTCDVRLQTVHAGRNDLPINDLEIERRHVAEAYAKLSDCDVIHDHTRTGPQHARSVAVPVVVTNHGPFDAEACERLRSSAHPNQFVVAISHDHARRAVGLTVDAVIHHGVDVNRFPFGHGGPYFVFLGRMSPDKGVHVAAQLAHETGVPLRIAAKMREPEEREYFRREVAPLLHGDVEYIGEVDGAEKLELLAGARALLNPIRWPEPFGMVMIEAMACGTPVIASRLGSVPEIVAPGTGFVASNENEFIQAIRSVDTIDREAVRARVTGSFTTSRMVAEHVDLYRRVCRVPVGSSALLQERGGS